MPPSDMSRMVLEHVLEDNCSDPDCEIHCPEVGLEEHALTMGDYALYVAGVFRMEQLVRDAIPQDESHDYLRETMLKFRHVVIQNANQAIAERKLS